MKSQKDRNSVMHKVEEDWDDQDVLKFQYDPLHSLLRLLSKGIENSTVCESSCSVLICR